MQIKDVLEPKKRNKELNDKQLKQLKYQSNKLSLSSRDEIYYNLTVKQSRSGFFSNERLLIANTKDKQVMYLSKVPEGLIPFFTEEEVKGLTYKEKITREMVRKNTITDFKCYPIQGKISSFTIQFKKSNNEKQQWIFSMWSSKQMQDWVDIINKILLKDQPKPPEPTKQPQPTVNNNVTPPPRIPSKKKLEQKPEDNLVSKIHLPQPVQTRVPYNPPVKNLQPIQSMLLKPSGSRVEEGKMDNSRLDGSLVSGALNDSISVNPTFQKQPLTQKTQQGLNKYRDHVGQLKYLRKENPTMFNTSNELSKPKLQPYQQPQNYNLLNSMVSKSNSFSKKNVSYEQPDSQAVSRATRVYTMPKDPSNYQIKQEPSRSKLSSQQPEDKPKQYQLVGSVIRKNAASEVKPNRIPSRQLLKVGSAQMIRDDSKDQQEYQQLQREPSRKLVQSRLDGQKVDWREGGSRSVQGQSIKQMGVRKSQWDQQDQNSKRSQEEARLTNKPSQVSKRTSSRKRWNEQFAQNANKLQIYQDFIHTCHNTVRDIVNELPLQKNERQYQPIQVKPPLSKYYDDGIIVVIHFIQNGKSLGSWGPDAPLLYNQNSLQELKRQFYNYNLILNVTSNQGFIKVPLCAYFEYKGIVALCKAEVPDSFQDTSPKRFQKQLAIIQNQIKVRFMFGSFKSNLHPNNKYLLLDQLHELIPALPPPISHAYFRPEFLLSYSQSLEDLEATADAHLYIIQQLLPQFLTRLQSLQSNIVCSSDLNRQLHRVGISLAYLPFLAQQTDCPYLRKLFLSELAASIFQEIFRSQINRLFAVFPVQEFEGRSSETVGAAVLDCAHRLVDTLVGYSNASEGLWKLIVEQAGNRWKIVFSKDDLIPGYLFSAVLSRVGLLCDFRHSSFLREHTDFFIRDGNLPRDLFLGFKVRIRRYDMQVVAPLAKQVDDILNTDPTPQNFRNLVEMLQLQSEGIPSWLQSNQDGLLTYMCNFVPFGEHQEFQHLGIYNAVLQEPHSVYTWQTSLLAAKWCIKRRAGEEGVRIFAAKQGENAFWVGQYNPSISEFYDFFGMYYASIGNYDEAIKLARLSLTNVIKVVGVGALPVADKHYQLGNVYFKLGRKEEALRQYSRTREILLNHAQTHISEYGVILLKLAILYLNFGKIPECVNSALESLRVFDENEGNEQEQIETFQILARCYQITKKEPELINIADLAAEKFNRTQDSRIFQRMVKIALFVRMKDLSAADTRSLQNILVHLQEHGSAPSPSEAFTFLQKKAESGILMRRVHSLLDNIVALHEEANRKDLFRRYKSLDRSTRNEAQELLVLMDALAGVTSFGFLLGTLQETYE